MTRAAPEGDRPSPSEERPATRPLDSDILPSIPAYVVLMVGPYGKGWRRPFLSLHGAVKAVQRARRRGLPARLVLCTLTVVDADLGDDGEVDE